MGFLKKFDKAQLWRFFIDSEQRHFRDNWIRDGQEQKEIIQSLLNAYAYMIDHLEFANKLSLSYLQKLHKITIKSVKDDTVSISSAEIRYQISSITLSKDNTSRENIADILTRRRNDATVLFNTPGLRKIAEKLDIEEIFSILQEQGSISYRNWFPNIDFNTQHAIDGKKKHKLLIQAKHHVQMLMSHKVEEIINHYNNEIKTASSDDEKLKLIAIVSRDLVLLQPFTQGNESVLANIILNQLLIYNDFPPAIPGRSNLNLTLSLPQWIDEIKEGIQRTRELLIDPNKSLLGIAVSDLSIEKKEDFLHMAAKLINKVEMYKEAYLTPEKLQEYTSGEWVNADMSIKFSGVSYAQYIKGVVYFPIRKENRNIESISKYINYGISAIVLDNENKQLLEEINIPVLLVDNIFQAYSKTAKAVRAEANPKTILITGTEGKTGVKLQLHQILKNQTQVHAILNSQNNFNSVYRTIADIGKDDKVELTEVGCGANTTLNRQRGMAVNPDICFLLK